MNLNVELTDFETQVVNDAQVMYARNSITKKVSEIFGHLAERYKLQATQHLRPEWLQKPPKITRGEQYLQLPYVVLDYPANFSRDDKFAIRTMFWWGNYFSIHLHMAGSYQNIFRERIFRSINRGQLDDWYICVNTNEWEHHFQESNYLPIINNTEALLSIDSPFLKMAKKIPLSEWNNIDDMLSENFTRLIDLLRD